jgi:general secretion pathway protein G
MRQEKGFTLIELLVVIAIITLMTSLVVVLIANLVERARYAKTVATIQLLDQGCQTYQVDFGRYPPDDKGGDSRCLHHYLGIDRMLTVLRNESGGDIKSRKPPIIEFRADILKDGGGVNPDAKSSPVPIVDAFGHVIQYKNPGVRKKKSVDLWSIGNDGKDDLGAVESDDASNWNKE